MTSNRFGDNFRITTFGESHGEALGVVIDGVRPGIEINLDEIQAELDRRRPGQSKLVTPRKESDKLHCVSGIFEGRTTGAPICFLFYNENVKSSHYDDIAHLFRPGHADFTWLEKFGIRDWRGGGRTSGRETIARVAAGSIARQLLASLGVTIIGHVVQIADVIAPDVEPASLDRARIESNPARCADPATAERMAAAVEAARKDGDSVGGIVEVVATGVPTGWGDPVFLKLDAMIGTAMLSIGATKGVEIGAGFRLASLRGSQSNDGIAPGGFLTNRMGGILGGISNGEPIVVRVAVKPTSSIRKEQDTINEQREPVKLVVPGRHDPCICPRLVPVAESMLALVLADAALRQQAIVEAATSSEQLTAELAFTDSEILRLLHRRRELLAAGGSLPDESALAAARREAALALELPEEIAEKVGRLVDGGE